MSSDHRPVLLLPFHRPSLEEFLIVADVILADGRYRPVLVLPDASLEAYANRDSIELLRLYPAQHPHLGGPTDDLVDWEAPGRLRVPASVRAWSLFGALHVVQTIRRLRRYQRQAQRLFDAVRPVALLIAEDRELGPSMVFRKVARTKGCFTLIVPFAYYSGVMSLAFVRKDEPLNFLNAGPQRLLKWWVWRKYPRQFHETPHGPMSFYPPVVTLALAAAQMLPPNPWSVGGGISDIVAISGQEDRKRFMRIGVPGDKITVTGQVGLDELYRAWSRASQIVAFLVDKYALDVGKKIVICAVPQLAEHRILDWPAHWEGIRFLVQSLARSGANVLLSLHPKSDHERYRFLEGEAPVRILEEPLRQVLPAADLFVAAFSSTVRWAVLLEIPAVIVDFYGFNYDIYDHLDGVVKVTDKGQLVGVLERILGEASYYKQLKAAQREAAPRVARFDGKAGARIMDLIETHAVDRRQCE